MFSFLRYDVKLEKEWMRDNLKRQVTDDDLERYRCMDDPATIPEIYDIGKRAAELQVQESHWLGPLPDWCKGLRASPAPRGAPQIERWADLRWLTVERLSRITSKHHRDAHKLGEAYARVAERLVT